MFLHRYSCWFPAVSELFCPCTRPKGGPPQQMWPTKGLCRCRCSCCQSCLIMVNDGYLYGWWMVEYREWWPAIILNISTNSSGEWWFDLVRTCEEEFPTIRHKATEGRGILVMGLPLVVVALGDAGVFCWPCCAQRSLASVMTMRVIDSVIQQYEPSTCLHSSCFYLLYHRILCLH